MLSKPPGKLGLKASRTKLDTELGPREFEPALELEEICCPPVGPKKFY